MLWLPVFVVPVGAAIEVPVVTVGLVAPLQQIPTIMSPLASVPVAVNRIDVA